MTARIQLIDLLISLLKAQAQTLGRLAALVEEDVLVEWLEQVGDLNPPLLPKIKPEWGEIGMSRGNAYAELESTVREFNLPALLEFYLWAYPHYRYFIEDSIDLNAQLKSSPQELADDCIAFAHAWLRRLPIPPQMFMQAEAAIQNPWIKFRAEILEKSGTKRLGAVSVSKN